MIGELLPYLPLSSLEGLFFPRRIECAAQGRYLSFSFCWVFIRVSGSLLCFLNSSGHATTAQLSCLHFCPFPLFSLYFYEEVS